MPVKAEALRQTYMRRVTELFSPLAGTTATNAADTPHTDALGDGSNVLGTTVYLVMTFLPAGYADKVYRVRPAFMPCQ